MYQFDTSCRHCKHEESGTQLLTKVDFVSSVTVTAAAQLPDAFGFVLVGTFVVLLFGPR